MKSKLPSVCEFGQLSLPSSFLLKPSTTSKDNCKEDLQSKSVENDQKKSSSISLSEFLNRKVDANALPPKTAQKKKPFSSLVVEEKDKDGRVDERICRKRGMPAMDETVFEQFKRLRKDKEEECNGLNGGGELGRLIDEHNLRKRRNPFQVSSLGGAEEHGIQSRLVILGDDPKPRPRIRDASLTRAKKPRALYNHYANGSGWWDCNMAGIDNEEVGSNEVWEGVGSTTLGGMQWH